MADQTKKIGLSLTRFAASSWILVLLSSCGSSPIRMQARDDYSNSRFEAAEAKLLSPEVVGESKSRLLTLLELGTIAHAKKEYQKSILYISKAIDLSQRLFTESVSEKALSGLSNDNSITYSGLDYELSMAHYYLVVNNLALAQEGRAPAWEMKPLVDDGKTVIEGASFPEKQFSKKECAEFVSRARSEVLAWDSFLETVKSKNKDFATFKDDIAAKLLGSFVHRIQGSSQDLGTAKILYQNAEQLLSKDYNLYATFNKKSAALRRTLKSSGSTDPGAIQGAILPSTDHQNLRKLIEQSGASVGSSNPSTLVVLEAGVVPAKKEKVYNIGLGAVINSIEDPGLRDAVTVIGAVALYHFAPLVLAAGVVEESVDEETEIRAGRRRRYRRGEGATRFNEGIDKAVGFKFKLPEIPELPTSIYYTLKFDQGGKVTEVPLTVVNPINDFARQEVDAKASSIAFKTGIRVGLKYLPVLVAAYTSYKGVLDNTDQEWLATLAGSAAWIAGKKIVDATESADIRAWNMLPQTLFMSEVDLPPGTYQVTASAVGKHPMPGNWSFDLGSFTVDPSRKNVLNRVIPFMPKLPSADGDSD